VYNYTNNLTDISYVLNTSMTNYYEAEDNCLALGGHLVSYTSLEEQVNTSPVQLVWCCMDDAGLSTAAVWLCQLPGARTKQQFRCSATGA
jgi:hypothetical protein